MKKARLACGIVTTLLAVGALTACSEVKYSKEGYILTYKVNGVEEHYTAEQLFKSYYSDADKMQTMFDNVYKLIVKNHFKSPEQKTTYDSIVDLAKRDVEGDKETARKNAETNGTSYDKEFETILSSNSCKDEEELLQHHIYERELKEFEEKFYDENLEVLRDGGKLGSDDFNGYIKDMAPYHVSHILVNIEDGASTNYWNGTVSQANCEKLNKVVTALAESKNNFGYTASLYSDDPGSKDSFGDLGIMTKVMANEYVDEFKLGMYAFENIYGKNAEQASKSAIGMPDINSYREWTEDDYVEEAPKVPSIPYEVFNKLETVSKTIKGYSNSPVHNDTALYFPRNVIFNQYLNKHYVSLIAAPLKEDGSHYTQAELEAKGLNGFKSLANPGVSTNTDCYLQAKSTYTLENGQNAFEYKPIIVARAGADSYQGIHFITANRTPFEVEKDLNGVDLKDYYTTYYPGQEKYPTRQVAGQTVPLQTYVNFNNLEDKDAKDRADNLKSEIKGYDVNLQKRIFKIYKEKGNIEIKDEKLNESLNTWINTTIAKHDYDQDESWTDRWESYISNLHQQKNERKKMLPMITEFGYTKVNDPAYASKTLGDYVSNKDIPQFYVDELNTRFASSKSIIGVDDYKNATIDQLFNTLGAPCNDNQKH